MMLIERLRDTIKEVCAYQVRMASTDALPFHGKSTPLDYASEVDLESQRMLTAAIRREFPAASIVAEEEGGDRIAPDPELCFVVDPLDGTGNYRAKIGLWAVSVALLRNGAAAESIIAFPATGEILVSGELDAPPALPAGLSEVSTYGIDSATEAQTLPGLTAKRRQFGSTVYTLLLCCRRAFEGRPALDLAVTGSSMLWDVAGPAAFLKAIGGAMIDRQGRDLTRANLLDATGGVENAHTVKVRTVASASAVVAREAYAAGFLSTV